MPGWVIYIHKAYIFDIDFTYNIDVENNRIKNLTAPVVLVIFAA